jgi:hypothetical protein
MHTIQFQWKGYSVVSFVKINKLVINWNINHIAYYTNAITKTTYTYIYIIKKQ